MAKKSRKELLKNDDAFINEANQSAEWIKQNKVAVIGAGVALFLLVAAVWGGTEFIRVLDADASEVLRQARALADAEIIEASDDPEAPKADPKAEPPSLHQQE